MGKTISFNHTKLARGGFRELRSRSPLHIVTKTFLKVESLLYLLNEV